LFLSNENKTLFYIVKGKVILLIIKSVIHL